MSSIVFLLAIVVLLAVALNVITGFHETANAIATVTSTRTLSPRVAVAVGAALNVIGALTGTRVAEFIARSIVYPQMIPLEVIIGGLLGAIAWSLIARYYEIPSSSSHALIGSVAGAGLTGAGMAAVNMGGIGLILLGFLISPLLGVVIGRTATGLLKLILRNAPVQLLSQFFPKAQIVSSAAMAFTRGANDAQKSMGIIALALFAAGLNPMLQVPRWVVFLAAAAMGIGTGIGGWRIIRTAGPRMVKFQPVHGFAAETAAALIIQTANLFALPVSTTHVISSAILGVGVSRGSKAVNWGVTRNIGLAMVMTIPASGLAGAVAYWLVHLVL